MPTARNVTVIPATFNPQTRRPLQQLSRRKVAGYARVSTDSDEQFTSYEARSIIIPITSRQIRNGSSSACIQMKA